MLELLSPGSTWLSVSLKSSKKISGKKFKKGFWKLLERMASKNDGTVQGCSI